METASKVMYTIANVFTWILALLYATGIVLSILTMTNVISGNDLGTNTLVLSIICLIVSLFTICLVRIAKSKNTSKGWDVLFIVLGVLGGNVFYVLGGIFGVVAPRR